MAGIAIWSVGVTSDLAPRENRQIAGLKGVPFRYPLVQGLAQSWTDPWRGSAAGLVDQSDSIDAPIEEYCPDLSGWEDNIIAFYRNNDLLGLNKLSIEVNKDSVNKCDQLSKHV